MLEEEKELSPQEWDEMLKKDQQQMEADPNNALNSPLGLNEEAKSNLTFMVLILVGFGIAALMGGGWYYLGG